MITTKECEKGRNCILMYKFYSEGRNEMKMFQYFFYTLRIRSVVWGDTTGTQGHLYGWKMEVESH